MKKSKKKIDWKWIIGVILIPLAIAIIFQGGSETNISNSSNTFLNSGKINVDIKNSTDTPITIGGDIINKNSVLENNYGNATINIYQTVNQVPNCPECLDKEYYPLSLHHAILASCSECNGFSNIEVDINRVKFNFPDKEAIFLDKLPYNEETMVGFCNFNGSFCHILPQYKFDKEDNVCLEINVSDSGKWNLTNLQVPTEERKCITLHDTNIAFGNISSFGLRNFFRFTIPKNGIPTPTYINLFNLKLKLPDGQFAFFDKFMHGDSKYIAFCNLDKSNCYINPEYKYSKKDNVCLEAILNEWDSKSFILLVTENRSSCVQDATNNKFLSECTAK